MVERMATPAALVHVEMAGYVAAAGGTLVLCSLPASLLRIFQTCCMEKLFVITKTRADALKK